MRRVFGRHADKLAGSSTKSMIGHPQGASGAAGVVTAALALSSGVLPPTINLTDPDPECDLDFIPNAARSRPVERRAVQLPRVRIEEQRARARKSMRSGTGSAWHVVHAAWPVRIAMPSA